MGRFEIAKGIKPPPRILVVEEPFPVKAFMEARQAIDRSIRQGHGNVIYVDLGKGTDESLLHSLGRYSTFDNLIPDPVEKAEEVFEEECKIEPWRRKNKNRNPWDRKRR
jgi:hypothetical protein